MTKTEALNKAAQEAGYDDFDGAKRYAISDEINSIVRNAMDIFAGGKAKDFAEWLHEHWNAKHGGWSAKTGDIKTVYSAEVLYKSFIVS